jgi:clan AA aspartic protease (TIGR02281 family)
MRSAFTGTAVFGLFVGLCVSACAPAPNQTASGAQSASAAATAVATAAQPLAPTSVQMEEDGGTFRIPVLINNTITLKFTIDSGASDVTIPADVMSTLVRTGSVTRQDFVGVQTFQLADGTTVPSPIFRIKSLKVGDRELQNVTASVTNDNGSLLLGQSFLSRLTSWSIDNQHHVLVLNTPSPQAPAAPVQVAGASPSDDSLKAAVDAAARGAQETAGDAQPDAQSSPANTSAVTPQEQTIGAQTLAYFAAWSQGGDADSVRQFYGDPVAYYGQTTSLDDMMAAKEQFAQRWPSRSYNIRPGTLTVACRDASICAIRGVVDYEAADPASGRRAAGVAEIVLGYRDGLIVFENGKVITRQ